LAGVFDGFEGDLGDRVGAGDGSSPEDPEPDEPSSETPEEVLARADDLLREAAAALDDNDLGEYQAKVDEAATLIDGALGTLDGSSGEPTTDSTPPASTPSSTAPASGG
jgi:hypothetical protein